MEHWHNLEREAKLEVGANWSFPDLASAVPEVQVRSLPTLVLETTYYDTADRRLYKRHIALRYRYERPEALPASPSAQWTIKLPGNAQGTFLQRTEVNWPALEPLAPSRTATADVGGWTGDTTVSPPVEAVKLVLGVTLGEPLVAVARLVSTRRRSEVLAGAQRVAEVDDDAVEGTVLASVANALQHGPVRFREIEVELAEGSPKRLCRAVVAALVASGARPSSRTSKFATVLESVAWPGTLVDDRAAPKAKEATRKPTRASTMAGVLQDQARLCLDIMVDHDPPIRLGDADPEHVHKARVATRRFRSVLWALGRLYGPSLEPDKDVGPAAQSWLKTLCQEIRWLGGALGVARDADVRLAALEAWCAELAPLDQPAAEKVVGAARHDQALAHRKLLEAMAADRYLEVLRSLEAIAYRSQVVPGALWQYLDLPAATAMAHLGAAQWGSLRRTVKRLGGTPCDEGLHRVRIQAKRLRYIAEAAAQVVRPASSGRAAAATALMATELQDVLGQLHDAVAHEQWLRDLAARGVPRPTAPPGQTSHGRNLSRGSSHRGGFPQGCPRGGGARGSLSFEFSVGDATAAAR